MAVEDLSKPTFHDDINADIATRSSSATVVGHYHHTAERIAGFIDRQQEKLDQAHSAVGRLAVRTGLFIPRQRVVEGFRQATQVSLFHIYNQRQGTFYSGLLERFAPEQWAAVPPLSDISEMTEDEASELERLQDYQTENIGDEPQFDLELEALRTARADRVAQAMIISYGPNPTKTTKG